jgi:hypothetical protein
MRATSLSKASELTAAFMRTFDDSDELRGIETNVAVPSARHTVTPDADAHATAFLRAPS